MTIREIISADQKSAICEKVLRSLPDWFGNESAILDYTQQVRTMPFYAACDGDAPVGFVALKRHNAYTTEVCVMGILPTYHRRGIGSMFIEQCERICQATGQVFLTVKTLDESAESEEYARTRQFYRAMGFIPLEVFPLLWNEANPCLLLAKYLG